MKKNNILSEISKADKLAFLNNLKTGNFNLKKDGDPQPGKKFDRIDSGLYYCKETNETLSCDQIKAKESDYLLLIELISDLKQPPDGFELIPFPNDQYLNSLLIPKSKEI